MEYWLPWKPKKDFDFKSGRRLDKMFNFCYFVSTKVFLSELLFLTKNNSFLQNRHFPVAMVTEWDKGELSMVKPFLT